MAGYRHSTIAGNQPTNVNDGTLCRAESSRPGSLGRYSAARTNRRIKVLGFDGAKVHDFLFHVALAEISWRELTVRPDAVYESADQKQKALDRASMLYGLFLDACKKGPAEATAFLAAQHDLQKEYLRKSQAILRTMQVSAAHNQAMLSEAAFGTQVVKSTATFGVAVIGLLLVGPEAVAGAVIAFGFDSSLEMINRFGSPHQGDADAVVVGFRQTMANDASGVAGSARQASAEATKDVLEKTLSYPLKSGTYRSAASTAARLDVLLKTLGVISAGITLYGEYNTTKSSFDQMQRARDSYAALQGSQ